ncbi:MAG: DUF192 domain-containing protein [Acidobacteria bacterium]|nr:DUF192 domain-containing protein [Acidobacteriota bacterium]
MTTDATRIPMHTLRAINISKEDRVIARRIVRVETSAERRRGLLGREQLDPDEGIYIVPCEWIHTFGMKFPIDVAFLASDGRVLAMHHGLRPRRLSKIVLRAEGVLELAAGRLRESGTIVGDHVLFRDTGANT